LLIGPVAQWIEQQPSKLFVGRSSRPGVAALVARYRPGPVNSTLTSRHARLHASVHEMREVKPLDAFPPVRRGEPTLQSWCRDCFAVYGREYYRTKRDVQKARLLRSVPATRAENRRRIIEYLATHPCVDCGEADIVVLEFDHLGDKVADVSAYASGGRTWARILAEIEKCEVRCANCHRRKTRATLFPRQPIDPPAAGRKLPRLTPGRLTREAALGVRACRVYRETKPLTEFPFRPLALQTRQWICLACQRVYTEDWYHRNRKKQIAAARVRRDREAKNLGRKIRDYLRDHPCVDCGESDPDVLDFDHVRDKRADVSRLLQGAASWDVVEAEIAKCEVRCANCHRRRTANIFGHYRAIEARMRRGAVTR
jgi:hypothetical protein